MATFIANRIISACKTSLSAGQNRYRTYFINTGIYATYKADVDTILQSDGYGDCIVAV